MQGRGIPQNALILPRNIIYDDFGPFETHQKLIPKCDFWTLSRNFLSAGGNPPEGPNLGFGAFLGRVEAFGSAAQGRSIPQNALILPRNIIYQDFGPFEIHQKLSLALFVFPIR